MGTTRFVEFEIRYVESYYKTHGNITISTNYKENGVWLGRWLSEQRQIYQKESILRRAKSIS